MHQRLVTLSKTSVSDAVLIAIIERDASAFQIDADQLIALRQEGVSEPVILAMLKSAPAPAIIVIGHDPERPTWARQLESPASVVVPVIFIPYFLAARVAGPVVAVNDGSGACVAATPPVVPPQVDPMTTNPIGHIWTPFTLTGAAPVAPCERVVPHIRVRPRR